MLLPEKNFLSCGLFYETRREKHRSLVTNGHSLSTIGDIVSFFQKESNLEFARRELLVESDLSEPFAEPLKLNVKFWNCGNNYFFNCLNNGFKKEVVPYSKANDYIKSINSPTLYSNDYYASLETMTHEEIEEFLRHNPIGVSGQTIVHGIHRACAMVNRLITGKKYIPFYVI